MSAKAQQWEDCSKVIHAIEPSFNALARIHNAVDFKTQAEFALAILKGNSKLARVAYENQDSLRESIVNVAAIGLSLSPHEKLAHLVPREERVCLDIGWRGLSRLATDAGVVSWIKAELVYDNDEFKFLGVNKEPFHMYDPFVPRGQIIGGYCLAKTPDGSDLVDYMSIIEIMYIRDTYSESYKAYLKDKSKTTPWRTSFGEMCKKTLLRRGEKSWPMTSKRVRLDHALQISLEADGFISPKESPPQISPGAVSSAAELRTLLAELGNSEEKYLDYLNLAHRRTIKSFEDLSDREIEQARNVLRAMVVGKRKSGGSNEHVG